MFKKNKRKDEPLCAESPSAANGGEERDREDKIESPQGDVEMKSPALAKLDNFWYYNKWKVILGVFLLFVAIVLIIQFATRKTYDFYVVYAGRSISRTDSETNNEYQKLLNSLERVGNDTNGNGKIEVALETLTILSPEEIAEVEATQGYEVNQALMMSDTETLKNRMHFDKYYVFFLSEHLYNYYTKEDGNFFLPLADYLPEGSEAKFLEGTDDAIYLSSLGFSDRDGFRDLPKDTVVVLRRSTNQNDEYFRASEQVMRNILAHGG